MLILIYSTDLKNSELVNELHEMKMNQFHRKFTRQSIYAFSYTTRVSVLSNKFTLHMQNKNGWKGRRMGRKEGVLSDHCKTINPSALFCH